MVAIVLAGGMQLERRRRPELWVFVDDHAERADRARPRHRAHGRPGHPDELPSGDPGADARRPLQQPRAARRRPGGRRARRRDHARRRPAVCPRQPGVACHPAHARALHRLLHEPARGLRPPPPRGQHARRADRPAEPARVRAALRRARPAGVAQRPAGQRRRGRHRSLQARERRARPRCRRRGAAGGRARVPPAPAHVRDALPHGRRRVPARAPGCRRRDRIRHRRRPAPRRRCAPCLRGLDVTCSCGVATADGTQVGFEMLERADAALYEAKRRGRDRVDLAA